jgi:hypothetical protein
LVQRRERERRDFNGGEGKGGEMRGGILIKYVFGSKERRGEVGRYFN